MANLRHLEILKQGVDTWNRWVRTDEARDYSDAKERHEGALIGVAGFHADLRGADLREMDLYHLKDSTGFTGIDLAGADLRDADLRGTNLAWARLIGATLRDSKLNSSYLNNANLQGTNLMNVDLSGANIAGADFLSANLRSANLTRVNIEETIFSNTDLTGAKGLDECLFSGPCTIDHRTLSQSGNLPLDFLRGSGLSDWEIESAKLFQPELSNEEITSILYRVHDLRAHQAIQLNPLFISYSHKDSSFVNKIEKYLNEQGIRFWRDIHHATAGRLERQVDRAIRLNPTVLLILSSHSVESDWVQHEVRLARKLELETKRDVLCPVALDASWKACSWPERLREQIMEYNILDFSDWKNEDPFRRIFKRLLEGLDLFYK